MEDVFFWGHHRGSDVLVVEIHSIGDFLCLDVVWYDVLA